MAFLPEGERERAREGASSTLNLFAVYIHVIVYNLANASYAQCKFSMSRGAQD